MKQNLQDYAHLAEIVGAFAIIVSLVFVGLEVRQSNTLVTTQSLRESTQIWANEYTEAFGSEEATAFMRKGANRYGELNKDEQGRFFAHVMGFVAAYDNIYNQYMAGTLREDVFYSIALDYYGLVSLPGVRATLLDNVPELPAYLLDYPEVAILRGEENVIRNTFVFLNPD